MIMDLYQLVRDLIEEAREQKDLEMVNKLIEIKLAISEIQDENRALKKQLEQQRKIVRHEDGNYVTLADDSPEIQYCSTCWGKDNKLIQLDKELNKDKNLSKCPVCFNNWLKARNGGN